MALNIYQVILGPIVNSNKAYRLNQQLNQLVLKVHPDANKPMIKEALEKLFNVKVKAVNTSRRKGKTRYVRRRPVHGILTKKAIVTLAEGYSLDLNDQTGSPVTVNAVQSLSEQGKE
ncbi:50S ribosomal protein L23 [Vermiphilus pyriformis]|jgi:large subunit ribosomal protein L23|nr:MAG: 50S ribosomal protein L23 [Vermiphilus pyriformis]